MRSDQHLAWFSEPTSERDHKSRHAGSTHVIQELLSVGVHYVIKWVCPGTTRSHCNRRPHRLCGSESCQGADNIRKTLAADSHDPPGRIAQAGLNGIVLRFQLKKCAAALAERARPTETTSKYDTCGLTANFPVLSTKPDTAVPSPT